MAKKSTSTGREYNPKTQPVKDLTITRPDDVGIIRGGNVRKDGVIETTDSTKSKR